VLGLVVTA